MRTYVAGLKFTDVSKERSIFFLLSQVLMVVGQFKHQPLKMKTYGSFETSGNAMPVTALQPERPEPSAVSVVCCTRRIQKARVGRSREPYVGHVIGCTHAQ
jgi:hypothetical protein